MGGGEKLALSPQVIDGMVFRGREYAAVDDLERALTRWAEEADAAGEPDQAVAFRHFRGILEEPLTSETIERIEVVRL